VTAVYVGLALIMFAFTYPSRAVGLLAPGIDRLPKPALDYLQLVGPAILSGLAAVNVMIAVKDGHSIFTVGPGVHWAGRVAPEPVRRARGRGPDRDRRPRLGVRLGTATSHSKVALSR